MTNRIKYGRVQGCNTHSASIWGYRYPKFSAWSTRPQQESLHTSKANPENAGLLHCLSSSCSTAPQQRYMMIRSPRTAMNCERSTRDEKNLKIGLRESATLYPASTSPAALYALGRPPLVPSAESGTEDGDERISRVGTRNSATASYICRHGVVTERHPSCWPA